MALQSADLQRTLDDIDAATEGMWPDDLARHPEGRWSPAEILEHLALAFGGTAKGLTRCLEADRPAGGTPTLQQRLATTVVVTLGYLPSGRIAPERTRPTGLPGDAAMRAVRERLIAMDEALARCEQRFGSRVAILDHPVIGPLSVPQWRKFHRVHTRHHMKQIHRIRRGA